MASSGTARAGRGFLVEIQIDQHLDAECSAWLAGLAITNLAGGEALLQGHLADQAALYGVLQWLRDCNIGLIALRRKAHSEPP